MGSFQDARWLRRLWSLAKPGDPIAEYISNVQLVQDRSWASSRERAPHAQHALGVAAAGAGVHNFFEIGGTDGLGPTLNLLHFARLIGAPTNMLTGTFSWALADGAALTTATRAAVTPTFVDPDPDVTPVLFVGTIATANIPAAAATLPLSDHLGETGATPVYDLAVTNVEPLVGLPFAASWDGPRNLIFFGAANELSVVRLAWQAIRS